MKGIKRLYDPNGQKYRKTGRTTIMAHAFIRIAQENPGEKIRFHDHYPGKEGMRSIEFAIKKLIRYCPQYHKTNCGYEIGPDFIRYFNNDNTTNMARPTNVSRRLPDAS